MNTLHIEPLTTNAVLGTLPPFPIVLVSTRSNIITINQVAYFTFSPLRIGIGVAYSRYTHSLLKLEREFVINIPVSHHLDAIKICGSLSGRSVDKFQETGLTRAKSSQVKAVSIAECGAHIECQIEQEIDFEERTWFIGRVVAARKNSDHQGVHGLLCNREHYILPGEIVEKR